MRKHLPLFSGTSLLIPIALLVFLLLSCGGSESSGQRYGQSAPKAKPFPQLKYEQAKNLMEQGATLYRQATNAGSQEEKNKLVREALERHFRPAQEILDKLLKEYPEHNYDIESLYQELNRKISGATKMEGTGD